MIWLFSLLADASTDKIDRTIREGQPRWTRKVIYEALSSGDPEAWAIVGVVAGVIVLLVVAKIVSNKMLEG